MVHVIGGTVPVQLEIFFLILVKLNNMLGFFFVLFHPTQDNIRVQVIAPS